MNTSFKDYSPYEISVLARLGRNTLEEFNKRVHGERQPSIRKVRARFQSVNDLLKKAHVSGVLDYSKIVEAGLWVPRFALDDVNKKPGYINFATHHRQAGESVIETFIRAVGFTHDAAEYYIENDEPVKIYPNIEASFR